MAGPGIPASPAGSKSKSAAGSKSSLPIVLRATTMSSWSKTQRDRPQEVRHPLTVAGGAPPNACYAELPRARDQPQDVRHPLTVAGGASPNACYAELPQAVVPLVVATGSEELESDEDDRSESDVSYDGGRSIDGSPRPRQKAHVASTRPGALAQETGQRYVPGEWRDKSRFLPTLIGGADSAAVKRHFRVAVQAGNCEQARLLLQSGLPPDVVVNEDRRRTGLHIAAERGDASICQLLLSYSADPHLQDISKWSPLEIARECDHIPVFHLLGGDAHGRLGQGGRADSKRPPATPRQGSPAASPSRTLRRRAERAAAPGVAGLGDRAGPELPLQAFHPGFMAPPGHLQQDAQDGRRGSRRSSRRARASVRRRAS